MATRGEGILAHARRSALPIVACRALCGGARRFFECGVLCRNAACPHPPLRCGHSALIRGVYSRRCREARDRRPVQGL